MLAVGDWMSAMPRGWDSLVTLPFERVTRS